MNPVLRSLLGCSGSLAIVLITSTVASPDAKQTIPFPEVANLKKVPTFNAKGMRSPTQLARKRPSKSDLVQQTLDWRSKTPEEVAIDRFGCDCLVCQNRAREMMGLAQG
jgi:hypothetical protein